MTMKDIAAARERVEAALRRRPGAGVHDDAPAVATWGGGLRVVAGHPRGHQVETDMPAEFGGTGDQLTPGWLFRAGLASCGATCIVIAAAGAGIELTALDVRAESRSDTRGILGLREDDGTPVDASPFDVRLVVRIAADDASPGRLRQLVEDALRGSPVPCAVVAATPLALQIDVEGG